MEIKIKIRAFVMQNHRSVVLPDWDIGAIEQQLTEQISAYNFLTSSYGAVQIERPEVNIEMKDKFESED